MSLATVEALGCIMYKTIFPYVFGRINSPCFLWFILDRSIHQHILSYMWVECFVRRNFNDGTELMILFVSFILRLRPLTKNRAMCTVFYSNLVVPLIQCQFERTVTHTHMSGSASSFTFLRAANRIRDFEYVVFVRCVPYPVTMTSAEHICNDYFMNLAYWKCR